MGIVFTCQACTNDPAVDADDFCIDLNQLACQLQTEGFEEFLHTPLTITVAGSSKTLEIGGGLEECGGNCL